MPAPYNYRVATTTVYIGGFSYPLNIGVSSEQQRAVNQFSQVAEDVGEVYFRLIPSSVDVSDYVDAGTEVFALTPSAVETEQAVDAGTEYLALTPSGVDTAQYADSSTEYLSLTPGGNPPYLLYDTFTRNVGLGTNWGTPDIGAGDWVPWDVASNNFQVNGSIGQIIQPTKGIGVGQVLALGQADVDLLIKCASSVVPAGGNHNIRLQGRNIDASNSYRAQLNFIASTGAMQLSIAKKLAGVDSTLAGPVTIITPYVAGTYYWLRLRITDTLIQAKAWADGSSEPTTWTLSTVDSAITGKGDAAVVAFTFLASTANPDYYIDEFRAQMLVEEYIPVDTSTANLKLTPASTDISDYVDSATEVFAFGISALEERQQYDAGTEVFSLTPSGADTASDVDTRTQLLNLLPQTTDIAQYVDGSTVTLVSTPSSSDTVQFVDSATEYLALTPTATDTAQFAEAGQEYLTLKPASSDISIYQDSTPVGLLFSIAGVEYKEVLDYGTEYLALVPSGVEVKDLLDSAVAVVKLSPSGTDQYTTTNADVATLYMHLTPGGFDVLKVVDLVATAYTRFSGRLSIKWGVIPYTRFGTRLLQPRYALTNPFARWYTR